MWAQTSVVTVLAFSVFFGFRVLEIFIRVSGRVFGPPLLSKRGYHIARDGVEQHIVGGPVGTIVRQVTIVKLAMRLVLCIIMKTGTILRLVTMVKLDMGMASNTIEW